MTATLKAGTLAVLDTFAGPIPCKVISIRQGDHGMKVATVRVTAERPAYTKGEIIEYSARWVVPRRSIYRRGGQLRIRPYNVEISQ